MAAAVSTRPVNIIVALKKDAEIYPALNDMLHMFSLREKARHRITLRALTVKMQKEKFTHTIDEYRRALQSLSLAGVGTLMLDRKGRVCGLQDLKYRIPELGAAIVGGQGAGLIPFKKKPTYLALNPLTLSVPKDTVAPKSKAESVVVSTKRIEEAADKISQKTPEALVSEAWHPGMPDRRNTSRSYQTRGSGLILTFLVNQKAINIPVPEDIAAADLAEFIGRLTKEEQKSNGSEKNK